MSHEELLELLTQARAVLERYMFEENGETIHDDVAAICRAITDALPDESRVAVKKVELERERGRSAA